jgi:hypothetical protein
MNRIAVRDPSRAPRPRAGVRVPRISRARLRELEYARQAVHRAWAAAILRLAESRRSGL